MPDDRRKLADDLLRFREAYDQAARDGTLTAFLAEHHERQAATLRGVAERQLNELVELEAERDGYRRAFEESERDLQDAVRELRAAEAERDRLRRLLASIEIDVGAALRTPKPLRDDS